MKILFEDKKEKFTFRIVEIQYDDDLYETKRELNSLLPEGYAILSNTISFMSLNKKFIFSLGVEPNTSEYEYFDELTKARLISLSTSNGIIGINIALKDTYNSHKKLIRDLYLTLVSIGNFGRSLILDKTNEFKLCAEIFGIIEDVRNITLYIEE